MKTAALLAFLLLGLACTYAVSTAEKEIAEDEPAAEDELIENDEEETESDEEEDVERRNIPGHRPCGFCRRKIVYKYGVKYYCIQHCQCKRRGYWCGKYVCYRHYPRCRY